VVDSGGIGEGPRIALGANTRRAACEQREPSVLRLLTCGFPSPGSGAAA
jgi:hypothetical protein